MKHTQGPWSTDGNGTCVAMGSQVVITDTAPDGATLEEKQANARLIAAAPVLLAALADVAAGYQQMLDVMPVAWQAVDAIVQAAIAKAKWGPS